MKIDRIIPDIPKPSIVLELTQEEFDVLSASVQWLNSKNGLTDEAKEIASQMTGRLNDYDSHPTSFKPIIRDATF